MNLDAESITIEETPPGRFPEWLFSHIVNQALDPRPISEGVLEDSSPIPKRGE